MSNKNYDCSQITQNRKATCSNNNYYYTTISDNVSTIIPVEIQTTQVAKNVSSTATTGFVVLNTTTGENLRMTGNTISSGNVGGGGSINLVAVGTGGINLQAGVDGDIGISAGGAGNVGVAGDDITITSDATLTLSGLSQPIVVLGSTIDAHSSNLTANSFIKQGGTNLQYLMADGSVTTNSGANNNSNIYLYDSNNTTNVPPPPDGNIVYNSAVSQDATTILYISHLTRNNIDIDVFLAQINITSVIYLQDQNNSANYIYYDVGPTAPIIIPNSYIAVPVIKATSANNGSTTFGNGHNIIMSIFTNAVEVNNRLTTVETKTQNIDALTTVAGTTNFTGRIDMNVVGTSDKINIGYLTGVTGQGNNTVAIGNTAGNSGQLASAIAIGTQAGQTSQGDYTVAIGYQAGQSSQITNAIAIGKNAATSSQGNSTVAIGYNAGNSSQLANSVAIGPNTGRVSQGQDCLALGNTAGESSQQTSAVAIGFTAGRYNQGDSAVAIGKNAGTGAPGTGQSAGSVAIGAQAGQTSQGGLSVAIGSNAGFSVQRDFCVAIGYLAGRYSQQDSSVAIGYNAGTGVIGVTGQNTNSVAIGRDAGATNQKANNVAIGVSAGQYYQGASAVAIGNGAGNGAYGTGQGVSAVAIGLNAGNSNQGTNSVAIGTSAGNSSQGASSVAIGNLAGNSTCVANSIVLNGSGVALPGTNSAFYVAPIRSFSTQTNSGTLRYDNTTKEIYYAPITNTIIFNAGSTSNVNATTYYFGSINETPPSTTAAIARVQHISAFTGTISTCNIQSLITIQATPVNNIVFSIKNYTTGISQDINPASSGQTLFNFANTGLIISYNVPSPLVVTKGDLLGIQFISPVVQTSLSALRLQVTAIITV